MGNRSSRQQVVDLPLALCATFLVMVCPVILVWWLGHSGAVTSAWVGTGIGVAVSIGASYVGAALWKRRTGSRDVLFGELMLWGWVQRWRTERRLASATDVLGLGEGPRQSVSGGHLTHEQRAGLLTRLASALEARDPYTHGHSRRVARHASSIAKRMGLPAAEVAKIRTAGVLHDVGKVNISTAVLHKEGKLTDGEFEVVKRHPVDGAAIVAPLGDDELTAMVRHHHERLDGTGYPDRLAGDAIPLGARILAVADTFDAITSTRPYRQAHAHKRAIDILTAEAGAQLDPDAVRAFRSCYAGSRSLALWTILANAPPRLASWLGGGLSTAKAASVATVTATAAATAAVGGAAVGPIVKAATRSHPAAAVATAPAVAPAARQRPLLTPAAGNEGGSPGGTRDRGKRRGSGGRTTAPDARRKHRAGKGTTSPGGATGKGREKGGGKTTAPGRARDHGNGRGGLGPDKGKRPERDGVATPRDARKPPAGGKSRGDGRGLAEGTAGGPGATNPPGGSERSPPRGPVPSLLDDADDAPVPDIRKPKIPGSGG